MVKVESKKVRRMNEWPKKLTDKIAGLLTRVTPAALRDMGRPKDLPPCVPDCGWNHGEPKRKR
jgi:hypothetical protein